MRQYMASVAGREVFRRSYEEALSFALASGTHPERMIVEPIPPGWQGRTVPRSDHDRWIDQIISAYGDIKPSMLQDFERGRRTEVDFINGYVAQMGKQIGVPTAMNTAITDLVHRIEQGQTQPHPARLEDLLREVVHALRFQ
jgi:2-dehydropantoate 2-reductase